MNFKPLNDLIVVKEDPLRKQSEGGIQYPQGALKTADQAGDYRETSIGTVVAVGPGDRVTEKLVEEALQNGKKGMRMVRRLINQDGSPAPMLTKVGDRVVFPRRATMPGGEFSCEIEGDKYLMFREEQFALAVIEE